MEVKELPKETEVKLEQYLNAPSPMEVKELPKETEVNFSQY